MPLEIDRPDYARVSDYFDVWSMHEPAFDGLHDMISRVNMADHVNAGMLSRRSNDSGQGYVTLDGGVAVIGITGTMMKAKTSFGDGASTVAIRQSIRAAVRDPNVLAILFQIDSPGGTVSGTSDLASEIAAAGKFKPTATYFEDLGASAAYWAGSQADFVVTNPTGVVGSIGTFMRVVDSSALAEDAKVKVHVIKAGSFKGAGTPGTQITDDQLAEWQRMVNSLNSQFVADALVKGRKMTPEQAAIVADGRVHVGEQAKSLGLVDAVQSFDDTVRQLAARANTVKKGPNMSAATLQELKAACPTADADFILAQLDAESTVKQAAANFKFVSDLRAKATSDLAAANAATEAAAAANGVNPLGAGEDKGKGKGTPPAVTEDGDPIAEFNAAVAAKMAAPSSLDRPAAIRAACRANPALHARYVQASNPHFKDSIAAKADMFGVKV